ncbi:MAG: hypothetical protein ACD_9C00295G0003, partial [uncultured bacterium]
MQIQNIILYLNTKNKKGIKQKLPGGSSFLNSERDTKGAQSGDSNIIPTW